MTFGRGMASWSCSTFAKGERRLKPSLPWFFPLTLLPQNAASISMNSLLDGVWKEFSLQCNLINSGSATPSSSEWTFSDSAQPRIGKYRISGPIFSLQLLVNRADALWSLSDLLRYIGAQGRPPSFPIAPRQINKRFASIGIYIT